ncbi:MAG: hemolysin III family protein [Planctomycetota bacterium]|nr:MAG: hemolysin III family protein [Planctomycetota bacterium]
MSTAAHPVSGQSPPEELVNSLSHGLGAAFGIVATVLLPTWAAGRGDPALVAGCAVFGASIILLYAASAVYHALPGERWKRRLQVLDHIAIYLLIAGTYTPFALGPMRGRVGLLMLVAVWLLALVGTVRELRRSRSSDLAAVLIYLGMGWMAVLAFPVLRAALPPAGLAWLIGGGVCYSAGTGFFLWRRLPFHHAVWHLFVLAGTVSHFLAILSFVHPDLAPAGAGG